ncbi:putative eukaryotic translation initiation factor 3 subunit E [Helianthus debilis subsp. tardiflorus]
MAMVKYDLTPRIAPNLYRHLVFPLLEFTQERQLYPNDQILKAKIDLLNNTNMVDYAMDIHTEVVPQEIRGLLCGFGETEMKITDERKKIEMK